VPYLGVDGTYTSDPLAAQCADDPRNPGRVVLVQMKSMSFYRDREGTKPLAEGCTYEYKGFEADPHYFPEFPTSVWLVFERSSGDAACDAFTHIVLRPPHGDGAIKHMHMRYGDASKSAKELLDMSAGDYEDADNCDPWWSVYCTEGAEGFNKFGRRSVAGLALLAASLSIGALFSVSCGEKSITNSFD